MATITGTNSDDLMNGTTGNDTINSGNGNDTVNAGAGNDTVNAGNGDDVVYGGDGSDTLFGENGNDYLDGGTGNDTIDGGNGNDTVTAGTGDDTVSAGNGNDLVDGGTGSDRLLGENGDDTINGGEGDDYLDGANGADVLYGNIGNDIILGGNGVDRVYGGAGNDIIGATDDSRNQVTGENGGDVIYGDGFNGKSNFSGPNNSGALLSISNGDKAASFGDDFIYGGNGSDVIYGDNGDNLADATDAAANGHGNDRIYVGNGEDTVYGEVGNDELYGEGGSDKLYGGSGNDKVVGGLGADMLTGGSGKDLFAYNATASSSDSMASNMDVITDFQGVKDTNDPASQDQIDLTQLLGATDLNWGGTTPTANGVWFVKDAASNATYVYADVNGSPATPELAIKLSGLHDLTNNDFVGVKNAGPVNALAASVSMLEDGTLVLSAANGNAVTVADADVGAVLTVSLSATHGTLALANTAGVTVVDGDGTDGGLVISGSASALNAALGNGLSFTPTANYNGPAAITVVTNDGIQTDTDTLAITIANVEDEAVGSLAVSGTAEEGGSLTASLTATDDDGLVSTAYQWQENVGGTWSAIAGADSATLTIPADQSYVGKDVRVVATTTDAFGGSTEFVGDSHTIANVEDEAVGSLSVSGTAEEGGSLTASLTATDDDGLVSTAYQWQENVGGTWSAIAGADSATLTIPADQSYVGKDVRVVATTTDAFGGSTEFVGDSHTIANVEDEAVGSLAVTGTAEEGGSLTASLTATDDDGLVSTAYQWQENVGGTWSAIAGADSATLTIPADQSYVGKDVRVVATTTDAFGGSTEFVGDSHTIANVEDEAVGSLSVSGTAEEGGSLTASLTATDDDGLVSTAYQWQENVGGTWSAIAGADSATLTIPADQSYVGKDVRVVATTTDAFGGSTEFVGDSHTIANVEDEAVGSLAVTGTAEEGGSLTASLTATDDDGLVSTAYQWQENVGGTWSAIAGADSATLTIPADQSYVGKDVRVVATTTDAFGGSTEFVGDSHTIANVEDEAVGSLSVSGTAEEGGSLTASLTATDDDGLVSTAYQWQENVGGTWSAIAGADSATLTIPADQSYVGKDVRVVATTTDAFGGSTEFVGDSHTIANVEDEAVGSLSVSGTAEEGGSLTASLTATDDDGLVSTAYQWQENVGGTWSAIAGADSATLTIPADQSYVGKDVRVVATTTDAFGGSTEFVGDSHTIANVEDEAVGSLAVTGTAEEGGSLTASLTATDDDGLVSTAYQWQENVGGTWSAIAGADSATLTIPADQSYVGKDVRVVATTTDAFGGSTEFVGDSHTIANVEDEAVGSLSVSGTAEEGGSLTASLTATDDDGLVSTAYQWQENVGGTWSAIAGADSATLTIPADQSYVGKDVRVVATTTDAFGGSTEFVGDSHTIANVEDEAVGSLSVSGTAEEGAIIHANSSGLSDVDGGIQSVAYQWQLNNGSGWSDIVGATGTDLDIPSDQSYISSQVRLTAVTTDAYGGISAFTSAAQTVANVNDAPSDIKLTLTIAPTNNSVPTGNFGQFSASGDPDGGGAYTFSMTALVEKDIASGTAITDSSADFSVSTNGVLSGSSGGNGVDTGRIYELTVQVSQDGATKSEVFSIITGSSGADTIGQTNPSLTAIAGDDAIYALGQDDTIFAGDGDDIVAGQNGVDAIHGGDGNDTLYGSGGNDTFYFDTTLNSLSNVDSIKDFDANSADTLYLDTDVFTALTGSGTLAGGNFASNLGGNAVDGNDYVVFDTATGNLYYDADGNGAGAKALFATITVVSGSFDAADIKVGT